MPDDRVPAAQPPRAPAVALRGAAPRPLLAEIRRLTEQNRRSPDPDVEAHLVRLRHAAYAELRDHQLAPVRETASLRDPFPAVAGVPPEIPARALTVELLRGAIAHHGCLLVRGLLPSEHCQRLVADTDAALHAARNGLVGAPWWLPFDPPGSTLDRIGVQWVLNSGTVYAGDAPRVLFDLLEAFTAAGIDSLVREFLGEHPALSLQKCAVRRVEPGEAQGWHQDGSLIPVGSGALNVWAALAPCGGDAPTLEIVPRRLHEILPTGTGPGLYFCASEQHVGSLCRETPAVQPQFGSGDALLFDEMLLHRTGGGLGKTRPRYSIEAWFFAPSGYPERTWIPLAW